MHRSLVPVAAACGLFASPAFAAFVDFNTAGDLATHFNAGGVTEQVGGGVGDTAAVLPDGDATAVYQSDTFGLAVDETFAVSMFVHKTDGVAGGSRLIQLGLGEANASLFTTNAADFLSARVDSTGDADVYQLVLQHRSGDLTSSSQGPTFTVADGRLYKFSVEIGRTGETAYTVAASLVDYGVDGQTPGTTVASFAPVAVTNLLQAGNPSLYAGFRGNDDAGTHRLDDFAAGVVPEPTALGLLTLGGLAALTRGR